MLLDKKDPTLEEVVEEFKGDRFGTLAGCYPVEAAEGHSVCEMPIVPERHYNLGNTVMGGAIFTLADFALAVACNYNAERTVSVTHTIDFMRAPKGDKLVATCDIDKRGRRMSFYTVDITDGEGRYCAKMTASTFTKEQQEA